MDVNCVGAVPCVMCPFGYSRINCIYDHGCARITNMGYNPGLILNQIMISEPIYYTPEDIESYRLFMRGFYTPITTYLYNHSEDTHESKLAHLRGYSSLSKILFFVKFEDLPLCLCGHHNAKNGYFNIACDRTVKWRLQNGK